MLHTELDELCELDELEELNELGELDDFPDINCIDIAKGRVKKKESISYGLLPYPPRTPPHRMVFLRI